MQSFVGAGGLALGLLAIGLPMLLTKSHYQQITVTFFIDLIAVCGLQVFMGNSGVIMLGHPAFMGIAAYVTAILTTPAVIKNTLIPSAPFGLAHVELGIWAAALIAVGIVVVVALLTGILVSRESDIAAAVLTLAILVIVYTILINWISLTTGPRAFYGIPVKTTIPWAMAFAMGAVVVARLYRDSSSGLRLRASSEDLLAAAAMGVHIQRLRLSAWVLSAALYGVAGVLTGLLLGILTPGLFYFHLVFLLLAMLLLGGRRSVSGAVVGTLLVTVGTEVMRYFEGGPVIGGIHIPQVFGLTDLFLGVILVGVMRFRPDGLMADREFDEALEELWTRGRGTRSGQAGGTPSGLVVPEASDVV
jgi:branched-chain amino acid transport system permease protein